MCALEIFAPSTRDDQMMASKVGNRPVIFCPNFALIRSHIIKGDRIIIVAGLDEFNYAVSFTEVVIKSGI